ncbi:hypothetical protein [Streptomyces cyaneofuscatus]|uniref:hypothetical protein n=1 Tax=Streptomyces cyaneofuscatus TaxID=66883 RepID=UPI00379B8042
MTFVPHFSPPLALQDDLPDLPVHPEHLGVDLELGPDVRPADDLFEVVDHVEESGGEFRRTRILLARHLGRGREFVLHGAQTSGCHA